MVDIQKKIFFCYILFALVYISLEFNLNMDWFIFIWLYLNIQLNIIKKNVNKSEYIYKIQSITLIN